MMRDARIVGVELAAPALVLVALAGCGGQGKRNNSSGTPAPGIFKPLTSSHLAVGSDPAVLPGPVLIADRANNRLLVVDPQGDELSGSSRAPGDLRPGRPSVPR